MLHLAHAHAAETGLKLHVVTVDHRLRPEAAEEAALVARACAALGLPHETLVWDRGPEMTGNLQDQARRARYALMADWAGSHGFDSIALAHTADDQAETFLMRLAREAGVDGLSGMSQQRRAHGLTWLRPLLQARRADLRAFLTERGASWAEDPGNQDTSYQRIRARQALAALQPLGVTAEMLGAVTQNLASARTALNLQARDAALRTVREDRGDLVFDPAGLSDLPEEIRRRLLVGALRYISSADYAPRRAKLRELENAVLDGRQATLHGCLILPDADGGTRIAREYAAVAGETAPQGALWDGRWHLTGPDLPGTNIRALGPEGLPLCEDWRETGLPRVSLLASPALWQGDRLISAPLAGLQNGTRAQLSPHRQNFPGFLLSD